MKKNKQDKRHRELNSEETTSIEGLGYGHGAQEDRFSRELNSFNFMFLCHPTLPTKYTVMVVNTKTKNWDLDQESHNNFLVIYKITVLNIWALS